MPSLLAVHEQRLLVLGRMAMNAEPGEVDMVAFGIAIADVVNGLPAVRAAMTGLERGPWLNYTTHQVACPVGPWQSKSKEALCTCGYTLLVDRAITAGAE